MRIVLLILSMMMASFLYAEPVLHPFVGEPIPFSTLQGKWVFINYWASWCEPCLGEISELNQFYHDHHQQIALFAVNYDQLPLSQQRRLTEKYHINYPALTQDPATALNLGEIRGIPVTFVFNPKGQWVKTLYGGQKAKQLSQIIQ